MGVETSEHKQVEGDAQSLASTLEPVLREQCDNRLSAIEWFRSTWQQGGAATGYATWRTNSGSELDVMVKLPIGGIEHRWTSQLGALPEEEWNDELATSLPTPRVLAHGNTLGGYDLAWLVIERLEGHGGLSGVNGKLLKGALKAAAMFHKLADACDVPKEVPPATDWARLLSKARDVSGDMPRDAQHWNTAIKHVQKVLKKLELIWNTRPCTTWCHGDLHPGNVMNRIATPPIGTDEQASPGACVLIDLGMVHRGHWVEDAVYLERLFWGHNDKLGSVKPVSVLAKARRELGLDNDGDHALLANVRRLLTAASVPVFLAREGDPQYVEYALATVDRLLPVVSK